MHLLLLLAKAFILGILVTAPVGPVGALVIRRSLRAGLWLGIFTGLGAALADSLFALLAALGLSPVERFLEVYEFQIALFGGVILLILGVFSVRKNYRERALMRAREMDELDAESRKKEEVFNQIHESRTAHLLRAAVGSFLITVSNPVTIVGFAGAFAVFGTWSSGSGSQGLSLFLVVLGVFLGAMSWWSGLSAAICWMQGKLSKSSVFYIQLSTSIVILVSGVLCLLRAIY